MFLRHGGCPGRASDDQGHFPPQLLSGQLVDDVARRAAPILLVNLADLARHHDLAIAEQFVKILERIDQPVRRLETNKSPGFTAQGFKPVPPLLFPGG
jgi:hypothetical protein